MLENLIPITLSIIAIAIVIILSIILLVKYNTFQSTINSRVANIVDGVNKANYDEYLTNNLQNSNLQSTKYQISSNVLGTLSNQKYWQNNTLMMGNYGLTQNLNPNSVTLSDNKGQQQQGSFIATGLMASNLTVQSAVTQYNPSNISTQFNSIKDTMNHIGGDTDIYGNLQTYGTFTSSNSATFNGLLTANSNITVNSINTLVLGTDSHLKKTGLHSFGNSNFGIYNNGFTVLNIDSNNNINTDHILNILDTQNNTISIGGSNGINIAGKSNFNISYNKSNAMSINSNANVIIRNLLNVQQDNGDFMLFGECNNVQGIMSYGPKSFSLINNNTAGLTVDAYGNTNINQNLFIDNKYSLISDYPNSGYLNINDSTGSNLSALSVKNLLVSSNATFSNISANNIAAGSYAFGQVLPTKYPGTTNPYLGGISTRDIYSSGYITAGEAGNIKGYMNALGEISGDHINLSNSVKILTSNNPLIQYNPTLNPANSFGMSINQNNLQLYSDGTQSSTSQINIGPRTGQNTYTNVLQVNQNTSDGAQSVTINGPLKICNPTDATKCTTYTYPL